MKPTQKLRQLAPEDPRHGTWAGYVASCRLDCCRAAAMAYQKRRAHDNRNGRERTVPATGTVRRLEALVALGWSFKDVGDRLGKKHQTIHQWHKGQRVYKRTAEAVAGLYDELSMTLPPQDTAAQRNTVARMKTTARRHGYLPPLVWDDIDTDRAPSTSTVEPLLIDEVKVRRVLDGWLEDCNMAERFAVIERWDGSIAKLEQLTGWHVHRMMKREAA